MGFITPVPRRKSSERWRSSHSGAPFVRASHFQVAAEQPRPCYVLAKAIKWENLKLTRRKCFDGQINWIWRDFAAYFLVLHIPGMYTSKKPIMPSPHSHQKVFCLSGVFKFEGNGSYNAPMRVGVAPEVRGLRKELKIHKVLNALEYLWLPLTRPSIEKKCTSCLRRHIKAHRQTSPTALTQKFMQIPRNSCMKTKMIIKCLNY